MFNVVMFCALLLGYTLAQLKDLRVTAHYLDDSFAAYGEAHERAVVPQHKLEAPFCAGGSTGLET